MDRKFLIEGLYTLLPIVLLFCLFYNFTIMTGDYEFHIRNYGQYDYPPAVAVFLSISEVVFHLDRFVALFVLLLLSSVILPYLLIVAIFQKTKAEWKMTAGWVYLYGSGVPFVLFFGGIAAQALIMVLMLFCVLEPVGLFLFIAIGPYIYREWLLAGAASFAYIAFQYIKPRIHKRWYV